MKMVQMEGTKINAKEVAKVVANESLSKSGKMKELFKMGLQVKEIATALGVRYNFVYNVVSNMVIVEGIEIEKAKSVTKKDDAFMLFNGGATVKETAIALKTGYQYIYKLHKEWKEQVAKEFALKEVAVDGGNK